MLQVRGSDPPDNAQCRYSLLHPVHDVLGRGPVVLIVVQELALPCKEKDRNTWNEVLIMQREQQLDKPEMRGGLICRRTKHADKNMK